METALPPSSDPIPSRLEKLHIRHALLVHGTFLGPDPLGLLALLEGFSQELPTAFRTAILAGTQLFGSQAHHVTDFLAGDIGNYSSEVCESFQQLTGSATSIERLHPSWSSENNHLARAQLALKLLLWLEDFTGNGFTPTEDRILFWGHSHAGNGFALLSNLLGGDSDSRTAFFDRIGDSLGSLGTTARKLLATAPTPHPMAQALHLVTFGTPVRYGWDTDGYRSLTHWIHHRPLNEEAPEKSPPALLVGTDSDPDFSSQGIRDILSARYGDWVQSFAIAGTDLPPTLHREENRNLGDLLERTLPEQTPEAIRDRIDIVGRRWKTAPRLHTDGQNVLARFSPTQTTRFGPEHATILGHGVYTTVNWLPRILWETLGVLESAAGL